MDGEARRVLVNTNLKWPNGLAIDHTRRLLYWLDASTKSIEMAKLDGGQRKALICRCSGERKRESGGIERESEREREESEIKLLLLFLSLFLLI